MADLYNSQIICLNVGGQNWAIKKIASTASNVQATMNRVKMSWPKLSTTIYPKQAIRVNTGWNAQSMPSSLSMTSIPHTSLIDNGLMCLPQFIDSADQGKQVVQTVYNNNQFPVKIAYTVDENQQQNFCLLRLNDQTLLQEQILQFDFGNLLTGVAQVAAQVLPMIL